MGFSCKRYLNATLLLAMSLLVFGCGGGGGGASDPTPPATIIAGKATLNGTGLAGVTMTIAGATSSTISTDASGNYATGAVANGSYTITPAVAGYTFSPASRVITVASGSVSVPEFTATAIATSFGVSGRVTAGGTGLPGVTVTIAGAGNGSTTTDAGGNYSFSGVQNGSCTITASLAGYSFAPFNRAVTVNNGDATGQDFSASAVASSFTVSGRVTLNGTPLAGVTVTIAGAGPGSTTTDASGNYSFTGVTNGNYTVTPALTGFSFAPANRALTVNSADLVDQDFTATPLSGAIVIDFG